MIKNDGGPAFPIVLPEGFEQSYPGMSLRDWFAGQAIQTLIAGQYGNAGLDLAAERGEKLDQYFAATAYEVADAMLAAREKPAP